MEINHIQANSLSASELKEYLLDTGTDADLYVFNELGSTNTYAKTLALGECLRDALVVALSQSEGRGRMGRSFYSPKDTGIYFTILHPTEQSLVDAVSVTSMAAVAVMRAIRALTGKQVRIKWVNDLYLNEKKVCGILVEAVSLGDGKNRLIIGIGVNWHDAKFPKELANIAGAVGADPSVSKLRLVAQVYRELRRLMAETNCDTWLSEYREHSMVIGKEITWTRDGVTYDGKAIEIDPRGALLVRTEAGEESSLFSGEITLRVR